MNDTQDKLIETDKSLLYYGLVVVIVLAQCWSPDGSSAVLPGGATPGGAQPGLKALPYLPEQSPELIHIPPREQQQLPDDGSPVMTIDAFKLEGAREYPDLGISVQTLESILEQRRITLAGKFSFVQIQAIASEVTHYYRKAGFIFARAFIPEQDVIDNIVVIRLEEGRLGQVIPVGNNSYSSNFLLRPFAGLINNPVQKNTLESALLQINDYPGLKAFGAFTAGEQPGTTDMALNVTQEQPSAVSLFLDNYGTEFTGENRARLNYAFNNISGNADRLFGNVLQTATPNNGTFGEVRYEIPVYKPGNTMGIGYSRNLFDVGADLKQFNISGTTDIASLYVRHTLSRSRARTWSTTLDLDRKWSRVETSGIADRKDNLSVLKAILDFRGVDRFNGDNRASVGFRRGFSDLFGAMDNNGDSASSRFGAGGNFNSLYFDYLRFQFVSNRQYLIIRIAGQYSGDLLTSLEQFSIGGADNVRAYSPSEYLVDSGGFVSLEWVMNAPGFADRPVPGKHGLTWGQIFQVSLFVDYAAGKLNDPSSSEIGSVDVSGVGAGLQVMRDGLFRIRADIATPVAGPADPGNGRDPQFWLNMSYYFQ